MSSCVMRSVVPGLLLLAVASTGAQQPAPATNQPPSPPMPAVGDAAPDFTIRGATRYGLLAGQPRLSDFRGQTVVLAFFAVARTRG
jgi:hypothetical protein